MTHPSTAPLVDDGDEPSSLPVSNAKPRCLHCASRTDGSRFRNMPGWVRIQVLGKWRWHPCMNCNGEGR